MTSTETTDQRGPRDHLPPHLRGDVPLPGPGGTSGLVGVADLVAFGAMSDPDPEATRAWAAPAEQAERPSAEAIAAWLPLVGGDEYAALLCATSEMTEAHAFARAGTFGYGEAMSTLTDTQLDVAQYYGETLADQHPAVIRAAGFRS